MAARYACRPAQTRGRLFAEEESAFRSPFQRDRDRIIHASAFRRLKHKTQVFVYHEGDHYRTRLTHSIEVAQIARSLARALRVDEDLAVCTFHPFITLDCPSPRATANQNRYYRWTELGTDLVLLEEFRASGATKKTAP